MCFLCNSEHKVAGCEEFRKLPLDRKLYIVKKNIFFRHCLNKNKCKCFPRKECGICGCRITHHKLLHKSSNMSNSSSRQNTKANNSVSETINSHSTADQNQKKNFRILPIRLYKRSGLSTYMHFLMKVLLCR